MRSKTLTSLGRRRLSLFALAILAPAIGLIVVGTRSLSQQRALTKTYLEQERAALVDEIGERLLLRLESVRLTVERAADDVAFDALHPSVLWVGEMRDGTLEFPWAPSRSRDLFLAATSSGAFGRAVAVGERAEFRSRDWAGALRSYERAAELSADPAASSYALLLQARVRNKAGLDAQHIYEKLLDEPDVYDEFGIPLGLYAASRLASSDVHADAVAAYVVRLLHSHPGPGKAAIQIVRQLADSLSGSLSVKRSVDQIHSELAGRTRLLIDSERAFSKCVGREWESGHPAQPRWTAFGASPSVCSVIDFASGAGVLAVDPRSILEEVVRPEALAKAGWKRPVISSPGDRNGAWLVAAIPGLALRFEADHNDALGRVAQVQAGLLALGLVFLIGVAITGTLLLWRDVKRELELTELRSQFVSSVSHELKTPLTAIRMFAETLRLRNPEKEVRDEYLDTIINESERLTRLLTNVLDFSKIERGTQTYSLRQTHLPDVVRGAARAMSYALAAKRIKLETSVDEALPEVAADRDALEQATLNLLTNAVKYSDAGSSICLRLERSGEEARISVADKGAGIEEAELERVFERFYRADVPENRQIPGTGLGLALVRHVAEGHGGKVTVQSRRGEGSCFTIHLPISNSGDTHV